MEGKALPSNDYAPDRAEAKLGAVLGTQRLDDPAVVRPALLPYRHIGVS